MTYKVIFLRHGECLSAKLGLEEPILQNEANGLTEAGKKEVAQKVKMIRETHQLENIQLYSSPILRAKETATFVESQFGVEAVFDARLRERDLNFPDSFTNAESQKFQMLAFSDPHKKIMEGESVAEHHKRVKNWSEEILLKANSHVIVVAHGGTFDLLQNILLKAPIEAVQTHFIRLDFAHYHLWTKMLVPMFKGYVWRMDGINL